MVLILMFFSVLVTQVVSFVVVNNIPSYVFRKNSIYSIYVDGVRNYMSNYELEVMRENVNRMGKF